MMNFIAKLVLSKQATLLQGMLLAEKLHATGLEEYVKQNKRKLAKQAITKIIDGVIPGKPVNPIRKKEKKSDEQ